MSVTKFKLAVLEGTKRRLRESILVANLVVKEANKLPEFEATLADPLDFELPGEGYQPGYFDQRYRDIVSAADALIIVTPEYNHSYPSSLKRMIDSANKEYKHKPVSLVGVSAENWGGVRALEALLPVLRTLSMVPLSKDLQFARVKDLFTEAGELKDPATYTDRFKRFFDELLWMTKTLKSGREQNG